MGKLNSDLIYQGFFGEAKDKIDSPGVLVLNGDQTRLYLFMNHFQYGLMDENLKTEGTVFGRLDNGKKVTLLRCIRS